MKKIICGNFLKPILQINSCFLILLASLVFFSCREKELSPIELKAIAQNDAVAQTAQKALEAEKSLSATESTDSNSEIDFDLSAMNSDLVYATVFQMMIDSDSYINKTVRMKGELAIYENSPTANGGRAYAVIISDALACCKQGIEFKYNFGENEPKNGDIVTVTGVYSGGLLPGDIQYNFVKASSVER